jgi:FKBP-type peptidyl-prolyl cis-trans isomerase
MFGLTSCDKVDCPDGYSYRNGVCVNMIVGNEEEPPFKPGSYYKAKVEYRTIGDSLFFKKNTIVQIFYPQFEGSIESCFAMLGEGDSASFILDAKDFFTVSLQTDLPSFLEESGQIKVNIRVDKIFHENEYNNEIELFLSWLEGPEPYEKEVLKQYIEKTHLPWEKCESGMYSTVLAQGNGSKIKYGDTITIDYTGSFIDKKIDVDGDGKGDKKVFDSTTERDAPFTFVFGTEMQVLPGIEKGLKRMTEGEKTIMVLPHDLAFGPEGSSDGYVPGYKNVIYEVELLEIKKGPAHEKQG